MILTSKRHAEHPFAGRNTQQEREREQHHLGANIRGRKKSKKEKWEREHTQETMRWGELWLSKIFVASKKFLKILNKSFGRWGASKIAIKMSSVFWQKFSQKMFFNFRGNSLTLSDQIKTGFEQFQVLVKLLGYSDK